MFITPITAALLRTNLKTKPIPKLPVNNPWSALRKDKNDAPSNKHNAN
jgi:hypothetical protein